MKNRSDQLRAGKKMDKAVWKKKQKEQPTTELPNTNLSLKKGRIWLCVIC